MLLSGAEQAAIVVAGALLTLLLAAIVVRWVNQEWRQMDARHRGENHGPDSDDAEHQAEQSPSDPPFGS